MVIGPDSNSFLIISAVFLALSSLSSASCGNKKSLRSLSASSEFLKSPDPLTITEAAFVIAVTIALTSKNLAKFLSATLTERMLFSREVRLLTSSPANLRSANAFTLEEFKTFLESALLLRKS